MAKDKKTEAYDGKKLMNRYKYGDLAMGMSGDKGRLSYTVPSMQKLYESMGLDADDPIINTALAEAQTGISQGHITNGGVFKAMGLYAKKFEDAYRKSKVSDVVAYVASEGFNDIPDALKALLVKYANKTVQEVYDSVESSDGKDKEAIVVIQALEGLRNQAREGNLYAKLVKDTTKKHLKSLDDVLTEA